jgi:hypothetical protein
MKKIKPFITYIGENFEAPGEAPTNFIQPDVRMGDTIYTNTSEELKSQLDSINSKLSESQFFLVEEDLGGEYAPRGVYNDLNLFIEQIISEISDREGLSEGEIHIEVDDLSDAHYILVSYEHSEDMFKYSIVTLNQYFNEDL